MTASLRRRALLIGTENHDDARFTALPSARADIEQLAQMLNHRNIGAFAEIRVMPDLRAAEMRHTIGDPVVQLHHSRSRRRVRLTVRDGSASC